MDNIFVFYRNCIKELLNSLPQDHPNYSDVLVYEQRLMENIAQTQKFGSTDRLRSDRSQIIYHLNKITIDNLGRPFSNLQNVQDESLGFKQEIIRHNTPHPNYGEFIGRKDEIIELKRLLSPQWRYPVIAIEGIGGIGKTALALEVAHQYLTASNHIPEKERFDCIIWVTAKQSILTADGVIPRHQYTRTLGQIYTTISIVLQQGNFDHAHPDDYDDLIRFALTQQRTLLIIDNLDTIDDESVISFILEVPSPTKVLVTTRHRIHAAYPVRLKGMDEPEALSLINIEANIKTVNITKHRALELHNQTGGVPLAIVWSIAQIGFGYSTDSVLKQLKQPNSEVARFCFESAINRIKQNHTAAYHLLMALSLFETDATREALGYVTELSEDDRDLGLADLEKLSLVNKFSSRFDFLPLTRAYALSQLEKEPNLAKEFRNRWVNYYLNYLRSQRRNKYGRLETVEHEINNLLNVMDWCWDNNLEEFIYFAEKMDLYLWLSGNWSIREKYLNFGLQASRNLENELGEARFLYLLGRKKYFQNDLQEAKSLINRAIKIYELHNELEGLANSLWRLATIQIVLGKLDTAKDNLSRALGISIKISDKKHIIRIKRELAKIDMLKSDYVAAKDQLLQARDMLEADNQISIGLAQTYGLLGRVALLEKDFSSARKYFNRCLEIGIEMGSAEGLARSRQNLAETEFMAGNPEQAKELADLALSTFSELGMKRHANDTKELLRKYL